MKLINSKEETKKKMKPRSGHEIVPEIKCGHFDHVTKIL